MVMVMTPFAIYADAMQGEYRRAHEVKLSTDALYETELAATHQAWELVVELKKNKLITKQQGEQHDSCRDCYH